jgi:hypothetical protein
MRTANSVRHERLGDGRPVMRPEWSLLDALGSPGRQSDMPMHLVNELEPAVWL